MVTWAVMKTGSVIRGGSTIKARVPVTIPSGAPMVLKPGIVFNSESQAMETLMCTSDDIKAGIENGSLQWRTPEGARRLVASPRFGNQGPEVAFGDVAKSQAGETYKNEDLHNLSLSTGENLTYSLAHLQKQDMEWKMTELNRQRPKMDVESMDESMLDEVLSQNHNG